MNRTRAAFLLALIFFVPNLAFSEDEQSTDSSESTSGISDIVGYKKGFYIQSPDEKFKLLVGGYIQGLFLGEINDGAADEDTFRVRRARLKFKGHLYEKSMRYQLEYDFAGNKLLTTYLQYKHSDPFAFTVGQFKVPYNVEGLSSGSTLQFVDRSLANSFFGVKDQREVGLGFSGALGEGQVEYNLATTNGEGINTLNQNNELRYSGRLVYNVAGQHGYKFSDTKDSEEAHVALGVGAMYNDTPDAAGVAEVKQTSLTADASVKFMGLGAHGGYFFRKTNPDGAGVNNNDHGLLVQAGYFFVPETWELGARYSHVFADNADDSTEYTGGLNYYFASGHRMKFQLDYSVLIDENGIAAGDDAMNHRVRAQLQFKI